MTELFPRLYTPRRRHYICLWLTSWDCSSPKIFFLSRSMICLILCVAHHTRFFLLLLLTNLFNELFFVFDNSIKEKREKKICFIMSTYCISYSFAFPTLHFYFIWLYYTFWRVFYSTANQPVGIITRRDEKKLRKNLVLGTLVIFLLLFFLTRGEEQLIISSLF